MQNRKPRTKTKNTSWENSHSWYSKIVGKKGHYYHQNVIIPYLKKLTKKEKINSVLDLGCGQGFLHTAIFKQQNYYGVDLSSSLIKTAKSLSKQAKFLVADVTKPLHLDKKDFDYAFFILSLQNMEKPQSAIKNASSHLKPGGKLIMVLNHPCFRIPKKTSWQIDEKQNLQYRKIDSYMTNAEIPIIANPGNQKSSKILYSYHHPISDYSKWLFENGFVIEKIDELISDKTSTGAKARMENKARKEFPLFLTIIAKKI